MKEAHAYWVAGHITCIFEIRDNDPDPLNKGSVGAGLSINRGVVTWVDRDPSQRGVVVSIDQRNATYEESVVSRKMVELLLPESTHGVVVHHQLEIPVGMGFGASAAAAIGLAFALNDTFELKHDSLKLWQTAHLAEVICKTGLGDVLGLFQGGVEQRTTHGAPGIGSCRALPRPSDDQRIMSIALGPILTKSILSSHEKRNLIIASGRDALSRIDERVSFKELLAISRRFTNSIGLQSEKLKRLFNFLDKRNIICSQIMLGNSAIILLDEKIIVEDFLEIIGSEFQNHNIETICDSPVRKINLKKTV